MIDMPYFMINEEWYYLDAEKRKYMLTDKATQKAKDSYEQYYKNLSMMYGGDNDR